MRRLPTKRVSRSLTRGVSDIPQVPKGPAIIAEGDGHFAEEQLATQTQAVGIIHPPPDIRSIVVRAYHGVSSAHAGRRTLSLSQLLVSRPA